MPIIFSSISALRPDGARVFFQAPDDALLASVVAEVASILGRHQAYVFHEPSEVPDGLVPVVLNCRSDPRFPKPKEPCHAHHRAATVRIDAGRLQGTEQVACKAGLLHLLEAQS